MKFFLASLMLLFSNVASHPAFAEEISVTQYGASLYGAPFAVAMAEKLFQKAGIDITGILGSGGGGTTVRNILGSDTPYGEVAVAAALAAAQQGLDLVIVNVGTRSVAEASLVTMPNSDVKSLKDLVGRKVAVTSPKSVSEMLFLLALHASGIDQSQVSRIYSGGYVPGLTLLEQGGVAAAVLIEPLSIIRADKYRTVVAYRDILPPMTTSLGITTRAYAKTHAAQLRAIIAGRRAGVDFIYAHPDEAAAIVGHDFNIDPAIARIAVANMLAPHMWSEGNFVPAELDRIADALRLIDEVHGAVDWPALIDTSFLPADLQPHH